MQITVKILNGQEVRLEVSENDQISQVKRLVSEKLDVPVEQQRLVFKGKTLADSSTLQEHQIVEGSKLHLSIRKPGNGASSGNPDDFFKLLREFVRGHFSEQDTERVMQKFREDFKTWVWSLSLDDIERMAALHLNESTDSGS
ncbi:hypothetical protein ACROYT_G034326 [Oculina patagonica]